MLEDLRCYSQSSLMNTHVSTRGAKVGTLDDERLLLERMKALLVKAEAVTAQRTRN
jgi:hypothetical protein